MRRTTAILVALGVALSFALCSSCRTNCFKHIRLGEISFKDATVADSVTQINVLLGKATAGTGSPRIRVDRTPAAITWTSMDQANSNAAVLLVDEYISGIKQASAPTNHITFTNGRISAWETARILAIMSGGNAYISGRTCTIRWGAPQLQVKQYKGGDWVLSVDLRRTPANSRALAVMSAVDGHQPFVRYVPETDTVVVLGTAANHKSFRRLVRDLTVAGRKTQRNSLGL